MFPNIIQENNQCCRSIIEKIIIVSENHKKIISIFEISNKIRIALAIEWLLYKTVSNSKLIYIYFPWLYEIICRLKLANNDTEKKNMKIIIAS